VVRAAAAAVTLAVLDLELQAKETTVLLQTLAVRVLVVVAAALAVLHLQGLAALAHRATHLGEQLLQQAKTSAVRVGMRVVVAAVQIVVLVRARAVLVEMAAVVLGKTTHQVLQKLAQVSVAQVVAAAVLLHLGQEATLRPTCQQATAVLG
jgi:sterol desaturase/sphingolipid hydroxylase (fatty acid hydroxylase superfamily)